MIYLSSWSKGSIRSVGRWLRGIVQGGRKMDGRIRHYLAQHQPGGEEPSRKVCCRCICEMCPADGAKCEELCQVNQINDQTDTDHQQTKDTVCK